MPAPARYFPVDDKPLRMKAGLFAFGADFQNGAADQRYFQVDDEAARYHVAKRAVPAARHFCAADAGAVHDRALAWAEATLSAERGGAVVFSGDDAAERYRSLAAQVQEDFAVLVRGDGRGRAVALNVCFPSGWRPERLQDASFAAIHAPVPGFAGDKIGAGMVEAMIDRGPFVRFVWTLSADDHLDHHPDDGRRDPWTAASPGFLRVERQVTVPLPDVDAAVFLIRTYVYPFASLDDPQRATLRAAVRALPDDIAAYKGIAAGRERALALLC